MKRIIIMLVCVGLGCLLLSAKALAVPKVMAVGKKATAKEGAMTAKDKKALVAARQYAKVFATYQKLSRSYLAVRAKIKRNKVQIKKLEDALKKLLKQGGTIYAKKGCPLGPKGRYCRWAKKKARMEQRLKKLRDKFKNL